MSHTVQKMFDEISPVYDRLNHLLSFNLDKGWRKKTIAMMQKSRQENFKALDVCCGTCDLSLECARQFPQAKITCIDFSQDMLNQGRQKITTQQATGQITPQLGDALNLAFDDHSFDVVFCGYGVRNLDDAEKGLREMARVLKPGGQVVILDFFKPDKFLSGLFYKTYARILIPALGRMISHSDEAYTYFQKSVQGFFTVREFKQLLKGCGFNNIVHKDFFMSVSSALSGVKG